MAEKLDIDEKIFDTDCGQSICLDEPNKDDYFRVLMENLIKKAKPRSFSIYGEAFELPDMLGLEIAGFGPISLPLVDCQAIHLFNRCGATVDENDNRVQNVIEFDQSRIKIEHPEWKECLKELVKKVARDLGFFGGIEINLHRVLVCQKGAHFLKHRDSNKEKNIFGTLIIQPPSLYTGGELVVYTSKGETYKVIDFGQKEGESEFGVYFAAHYADLEHEILEIKSGYRLALVYFLCWKNEIGSLIFNRSCVENLSKIMNVLNSNWYQIGVFLVNKYTSELLKDSGIKALIGIDQKRLETLLSANDLLSADKKISVFICEATLVVCHRDTSGYYNSSGYISQSYSYEWELMEKLLTFSEWYDQHGNPVMDSSKLNNDTFTKIFHLGRKNDEDTVDEVDLMDQNSWRSKGEIAHQFSDNHQLFRTTTYCRRLMVFCPEKFLSGETFDASSSSSITLS